MQSKKYRFSDRARPSCAAREARPARPGRLAPSLERFFASFLSLANLTSTLPPSSEPDAGSPCSCAPALRRSSSSPILLAHFPAFTARRSSLSFSSFSSALARRRLVAHQGRQAQGALPFSLGLPFGAAPGQGLRPARRPPRAVPVSPPSALQPARAVPGPLAGSSAPCMLSGWRSSSSQVRRARVDGLCEDNAALSGRQELVAHSVPCKSVLTSI